MTVAFWFYGFTCSAFSFSFFTRVSYVQIFVNTSTFTTHIILIFSSERRELFGEFELISAVCLPVHTVQCLKLTENCTASTEFISKNKLNSAMNFIRNTLQWRHLEKKTQFLFAEKSRWLLVFFSSSGWEYIEAHNGNKQVYLCIWIHIFIVISSFRLRCVSDGVIRRHELIFYGCCFCRCSCVMATQQWQRCTFHSTLSELVLPVKHYYHYYIAQFHLTIKLVLFVLVERQRGCLCVMRFVHWCVCFCVKKELNNTHALVSLSPSSSIPFVSSFTRIIFSHFLSLAMWSKIIVAKHCDFRTRTASVATPAAVPVTFQMQ